jgi:hypothetical protein
MKIIGKVLDVNDNQPLGGASLMVYNPDGTNSKTGTIALEDGSFVLDSNILDKVGAKVGFSFVGYEPVKLSVAYSKDNVYLSRVGDSLGAVIVTAKMNSKKPVLIAGLVLILIIALMIILFAKLFKAEIKN